MIGKPKQYCDKCGEEIEHNFYHSIEWTDYYAHTKERKCKRAEICNACYEKAFHTFFQCGEDIPNTLDIDSNWKQNEECHSAPGDISEINKRIIETTNQLIFWKKRRDMKYKEEMEKLK